MKQIANSVLMIRPVAFRMNEQTAVNNYFQKNLQGVLPETINAKAQKEFDALADKLKNAGVEVIVIEDTMENDTPDSVFPSTWISFHQNGDVVLYPMFAENRRQERKEEILDVLEEKGFRIENIIDYTAAEEEGLFLEGNGSLVLDRVNAKAYCALSERSNEELFIEFCEDIDYAPVIFEAYQKINGQRTPIFHTNLMMTLGEKFAVIYADGIEDKKEYKMVLENINANDKEIIFLTDKQINFFAGNLLELRGRDDDRFIVMSAAAHQSLTPKQLQALEKYGTIISADLETIEACGGGSVGSMLAEIFLPKA